MKTYTMYFPNLLWSLLIVITAGCSGSDSKDPDPEPIPGGGTILMFISKEQTYYSEYKIMLEALQAAGYTVDVRSAASGTAAVYSVTGNIDGAGNQTPGATYAQFTTQFQNDFGKSWNASWNATPATVPVNGRIQDVVNMSSYDALVIPGGTGANDYRRDEVYAAQGAVSAADVQAAAEKLNALAIEALLAGKPVMALCHGASLPAFFKIPETGESLLKGQYATGFPEAATANTLISLGANYREPDRVTVSSPNTDFVDSGAGDYKVITTKDWYAQSVAYGARTLLNLLSSYPSKAQREANTSVLILHGGMVNAGNCGATNKANDVPCNYGNDNANLPVDYTQVRDLLIANSPNDNYVITVDDWNLLTEGAPTYNDLKAYDVVLFFKHWSSGVTTAFEDALVDYADDGGGVVGLHHALYNESEGSLNKNILVNQLFGAASTNVGFVLPALEPYRLFVSNYGHFIATYGVSLAGNASLTTPASWSGNMPPSGSNLSYSYYQNFPLYDELYHNLAFVAGQSFGRSVNQITPIFSNAETNASASQVHTAGFVKLFNPSGNSTIGRVVYFQAGERKESVNINSVYGQVVRNAVVWAAQGNK